jgi:ABC-type dipeptide/oligopeptide/nickel transport system permease subunit
MKGESAFLLFFLYLPVLYLLVLLCAVFGAYAERERERGIRDCFDILIALVFVAAVFLLSSIFYQLRLVYCRFIRCAS